MVIATGEQTEFGVIFTMMQDVRRRSPKCGTYILTECFRPIAGGREANAFAIEYGRASQEAVNVFLRCHWFYLYCWRFTATTVVGHVHDRRYVV